MEAWYECHVERTPGVQGGEPVLRGTRTPVRTVVVLWRETYPGRLDDVQAALPHLTRQQIEAALAYYADHRTEIDAEIERQHAALRRLHRASRAAWA